MKNLIIIGARGFGREIYDLALKCPGYKIDYTIKGFLDDKADALEGFENYPAILSSVEEYEPNENDVFTCALGSVKSKMKYAQIILDKDGAFINLIHPSTIINTNVKLGIGLIILSHASISNDCTIADFVTIQGYTALGHDVQVGTWCHMNAFSFMGGFAVLEDQVTLHIRASVLPHVTIGSNAVVGASSLAIKNVPADTTVFGLPAKKLTF